MFERTLLLWLCVSSAVALYWPQQIWDPFLASDPYLLWLIFITMFHVGAMLPRDEVDQMKRRWPSVLFGTAVQYIAMPLLGWGMAKMWNLPLDYQIGLILVGCVPGAMASNVVTMNARGHTSYSVSLTTASTLLSPIVVPFALSLALGDVAKRRDLIDPWTEATRLFVSVVFPVLLGASLARLLPRFDAWGNRWGAVVANLVILWVIATVVAKNRGRLQVGTLVVVVPLLVINILGYVTGYFAGRMARQPESMRRALTIEVGMQNAGLGTALAAKIFPDRPDITVPTALYTFGCVLTATILARWWAAKELPEESAS